MSGRKQQRQQAKKKDREKRLALKANQERVSRLPERLEAGLEEVDKRMMDRRYAEAKLILSELAIRWPNRPEIVARQCEANYELNDEVNFLVSTEHLARLQPNNPDFATQYCFALSESLFPALATQAIKKSVERWPDHQKLQKLATTCLPHLQQIIDERLVRKGYNNDERAWKFLEKFDQVYMSLIRMDFPKVIREGEDTLREYGPDCAILNNMSEAHFHLGQIPAALDVARQSFDIDSTDLIAASQVIRLELLLGHRDLANSVADSIRDIRPVRFDFWSYFINSFVQLERDEEALKLGSIVENQANPSEWNSRFGCILRHALAVANARTGRTTEARKLWLQIIGYNPGFELAIKNLEDLQRPIENRNGPVFMEFPTVIPKVLMDRVAAELKKTKSDPPPGVIKRFLEQLESNSPGLIYGAEQVLRSGCELSRKLLISLTISSAHPNLLGWLKEFTSGDRGSDELRMEAMFKLRKIDAIDGEQRRFFSKGKWIQAEIPLLTVHGEPKFAVSDQVKRLLDQAVAFLGQRMFKQAEEACREAIRIDPKQVVAYNNLATSLLNQNRLREAEQTLKHVLTIDDLNVTARVNLARLASYKGNEEQAEEWVRPVRKLESLHYADLGSLISYDFANAISRRDFLAARQHLNMLKDAVPNYPQIPQFERMIP